MVDFSTLPGNLDILGNKGFYDWTMTADPATIRAYAERYGMTPSQLANSYNAGGGFAPGGEGYVAPDIAAKNIGANSANEILGNYWKTQDPKTGQYAPGMSPTTEDNYSGWSPGEDYDYTGKWDAGNNATIPGNETKSKLSGEYGTYWNNDPTDLFQPNIYSTSQSGSKSMSNSGSTSESFNGLDDATRAKILESVAPALTSIIEKLKSAPGDYSKAATDQYKAQTRDDIETVIPQIMEEFSSKNLMNSSMQNDVLSRAISEIVKSYGEKGRQAKMDEATMLNDVAKTLGGITGLGQFSKSTGASTGTSESESSSLSQNPGEAYDRILNWLLNY